MSTRLALVATSLAARAGSVAVPAAAPVLVLLAQSGELIPPSISNLVTNSGVGVALIVVVRMFLQANADSQKLQMAHQTEAFTRFEVKLDQIESRHAKDEQDRHEQLRAIIDRMLLSQERLSERLAELRAALDALAASNRGHEAAIQAMQAKLEEYQKLLGEFRDVARKTRQARGDAP